MRSSSAEESRITLERPHTVLLLASLRGGYATRGAYTNAMADEFRKVDGKSDIYEMHSRAVVSMQRKVKIHVTQTPEFRSTLAKRLVLHQNMSMQYQ